MTTSRRQPTGDGPGTATAPQGPEVLLRAQGLVASYAGYDGRTVRAVDDVSLDVVEGEILGVAGESGCGKSTLGAILSLTARPPLQVEAGSLEVGGTRQELGGHRRLPRTWRGSVVSLLPQGALNSLSPTVRIRNLVVDVVRSHDRRIRPAEAVDRARDRFTELGLPPRVLDSYPHQLSGGMKQRVITVVSTLLDPTLLIADEPTSALDVSSQRALTEMLRQMLEARIMSGVIFITHDLPLLRTVSDRIAVMYAGQLAEVGPAEQLAGSPRHPYSAALLNAVLAPELATIRHRVRGISGSPPDLADPPPGCRFHPRCGLAMPQCHEQDPPRVGDELAYARCWWSEQHDGAPVRAAQVVGAPEVAASPGPDRGGRGAA